MSIAQYQELSGRIEALRKIIEFLTQEIKRIEASIPKKGKRG